MSTSTINLKIISMSLFAIGAMTSISNAAETKGGPFIEPSITYEVGDSKINYPSPLSNSSGRPEGFGLGARIGFHIDEAIFAGLDVRYAIPQYKDSSVNYNARSYSTNWGPVIGIQMPDIGMRLWGSYIIGGILNPEKSGSLDVKFKEASGYRLGAGFRISTLSLNLEYQNLKYHQSTLEQIGPFTPGSTFDSVNLENSAILASVSFPLEL